VLLNVGLCITFYDFVSIGEPYLYPSEGSALTLVKFRMIVFRPFVGEIITGTLVGSNKDGVKISLGLFSDVLVPAPLLQAPCEYDSRSKLWVWKYDGNDFVMEIGEKVSSLCIVYTYKPSGELVLTVFILLYRCCQVRFKVRTITFTALTNSVKGITATTTSESQDPAITSLVSGGGPVGWWGAGPPLLRRRSSSVGLSPEDEVPSAMEVIGAMNDYGLGLASWW
jgi:DNA-directed RNA polymerase III subunit RPC8